MKKHNLTTNFIFIKTLKNSRTLGHTKLKEITEEYIKENNDLIFRSIYYKNAGDEFQVGKLNRGTIKLTEYKNNIPQPIQYLKLK
jgi:hypothetical protein